MSEPISLYKKFTGTAGVMIISRCLAMVLGIIYARYLGPEQFGLYSFVLSIVAMATLPVVAGLPNLLVREVAAFHFQEKWGLLKGIINWSRLYILGASLIVMSLMSIALYFDIFEASVSSLLWFALFLIPLRGFLIQQGAILNGLKKPILAQLPDKLLAALITILILFSLISLGVQLTAVNLIYLSIISSVIAFLISWNLLKWVNRSIGYNKKIECVVNQWHKDIIPFTFISFFTTFNIEITSIILGLIQDKDSVAYFKVAMQAVALIILGLSSVNAVIMPNIAQLYQAGEVEYTQALLTKSVRLSFFLSLPVIVLLIVFGKSIIILLFGETYLEAYPILLIMTFGQLVKVLIGPVDLVLNMTGHERKVLKNLATVAVLNSILLVILIPCYGYIGAAISVSISSIIWSFLMAIDTWKHTGLKTWLFAD